MMPQDIFEHSFRAATLNEQFSWGIDAVQYCSKSGSGFIVVPGATKSENTVLSIGCRQRDAPKFTLQDGKLSLWYAEGQDWSFLEEGEEGEENEEPDGILLLVRQYPMNGRSPFLFPNSSGVMLASTGQITTPLLGPYHRPLFYEESAVGSALVYLSAGQQLRRIYLGADGEVSHSELLRAQRKVDGGLELHLLSESKGGSFVDPVEIEIAKAQMAETLSGMPGVQSGLDELLGELDVSSGNAAARTRCPPRQMLQLFVGDDDETGEAQGRFTTGGRERQFWGGRRTRVDQRHAFGVVSFPTPEGSHSDAPA